jgi:4-hydroxy-3-methylbut-2-enyl diphosphate reductase
MMPFGAFAQIIPGVDGLIHITQIANRRIAAPAEVLTLGQVVDVKIVDIDTENHKVSLSIRALIEAAAAEEAVEAAE